MLFAVVFSNEWKVVHIWTDYLMGFPKSKYTGQEIFKTCPEPRCVFAERTQHSHLADAILFPWTNIRQYSRLPTRSSPSQMWVFFTLESPDTDWILRGNDGRYGKYNNFFNWTMTYRTDSDIHIPYGKVVSSIRQTSKDLSLISNNKSKIAAIFLSNCDLQPSGRTDVLAELQRYLPVDIYGDCGSLKCARANEVACWLMVGKTYKFYLSFENSICKDYATEKFFNALKYGVVPVVLGGGNYKKIAPQHSFIDITDFKSVEQLAKHLIQLDEDNALYRTYFDWKEDKEIKIANLMPRIFCDLCEKLHSSDSKTRKIYKSIKRWWLRYPCFHVGSQMVSRMVLDEMYGYDTHTIGHKKIKFSNSLANKTAGL